MPKAGGAALSRPTRLKPLPEHVNVQDKEYMIETKTKGQEKEKNIFVKLPKSWKKAQLLYRRVTSKEFVE
jgi:hypothetical protein